jgi:hypothetical protein
LYNLKDDIGETKNRAAERPELVKDLNELIAGFLNDTGALIPTRNPNYDPAVKPPEGKPARKPTQKRPPKEHADMRIEMEKQTDEDVLRVSVGVASARD